MTRTRTAMLAALTLVAGASGTALAAHSASAGAAAAACTVDYQVQNDWGSGFTAAVTVTNNGAATSSWSLGWTYAGSQKVTNSWNAKVTQSGAAVTAANESYNGTLSTGGSASFGFQGTYSGSNAIPATFTLNGVTCNVDGGTDPTDPPTDPTDPPTDPTGPGDRVDNPYDGAQVYVNPEWSANAAAEPGGDRIADEPTGVWLDRIAAIEGANGGMGLRDHLDAALEQKGSGEMVVQLVIYNLPGRDCSALASNGELGPTEIDRYKTEYIDPIAEILSDSKYADLRIVTTVEIDSLPNLVTNVSGRPTATENCDVMKANGNYQKGVGYALNRLGAVGNVYNYVDAGHHGWLGWDSNFGPSAEIFKTAATTEGATLDDVHGFIVNTANYSALKEENFKITDSVNGTSVRQSDWVDWNQYTDELSYAQAMRDKLVSLGFDQNLGMLIDTSRNGWGGADRPSGPGATTDVNTYVNGGRYDRRIHLGNWCNQSGAGLGERPQASPAAGIDAYVWMKPPGESDGSSKLIDNPDGKGFDRMCDPTYTGNERNGNSMSGALPDAPISGAWFSAQFQELMKNAYPPLS
ncbi:cellulose 1,4-beta-cellobiosidase [Streptomyces violaceoruber]|uniref:Glucanase n=2 Tax=Streptomyces violaceoruber group TaxID=2867121 RepID=A0ABT4NXU9_9ACTN|nr:MULTISPECIES: cellulose 1,4-beta-cellobiosidase [Streptomyces]MBQ0950333.1 cellulose 1,4-beta-cellobiosidase [Streptomyces sp. RK76]MCW8119018.1 cellulose 1,4-beta-cellobiosidase [Streptomyces anthocyanicus]MCZ4633938.1 cellulose 1,4-beta-cellobiosidase [Streptomyces rubrogriseus]WTC47489.1 cellulose 1,4-beta-cellobiosidase [Streptomyces anthocyanicus]